MSWFDNIIPSVKRKKKNTNKSVPEGTWLKCQSCQEAIFDKDFKKHLGVCTKCNFHHFLVPQVRAKSIFDEKHDYAEIAESIRPKDFLKFQDIKSYKERISTHSGDDETKEALRVYHGKLGGNDVVLACFDFTFMGGSMGSVVGERFIKGVDFACDHGAAFLCFTASGGARMQEGLTSLFQMAKTTAAQAKLKEYGLPFISVLCNPTTGGVSASFAMVADVIIAEPGATIGFAGQRVIKQTVGEELPEGFQSSELLLKLGSIDMVVDRRELRDKLISITSILHDAKENQSE